MRKKRRGKGEVAAYFGETSMIGKIVISLCGLSSPVSEAYDWQTKLINYFLLVHVLM